MAEEHIEKVVSAGNVESLQKKPIASAESRDLARATLACVVPMMNEAGHADQFVLDLLEEGNRLFGKTVVIVIDDGSSDNTVDKVSQVVESGKNVHLLSFSRNFGKEVALTAGLDAIDRLEIPADAVLMIDSDYQHPFSVIKDMAERWAAGVDMVYGVQAQRESSKLRQALIKTFYRLLTSTSDGVEIPPNAGDFRLMDRKVLNAINRLPERSRYMKGLYAWVGFNSEGVEFTTQARASGTSSFGFRRLAELALDGITAFTSWPLRLASIVGFFISLFAFVYGTWIVVERLWIGQPIPGFATLAAAIMLFSGIQLLSIGLLGEYLGRVFNEVKGRPLYLIEKEVSPDSEDLPDGQHKGEDRGKGE